MNTTDLVTRLRPGGGRVHYQVGAMGEPGDGTHTTPRPDICDTCAAADEIERMRALLLQAEPVLRRHWFYSVDGEEDDYNNEDVIEVSEAIASFFAPERGLQRQYVTAEDVTIQ